MIEILQHSAAPEAESSEPGATTTLGRVVQNRRGPLLMILVVVTATMAYSLLWAPFVRHHSYWITPGDIWGTLRTAQFVGWGDIGDVYGHGTGLVSFPGISVVLAPVALLISHLALSISFPYGLAHPSGWLALGPYEAAVGAIVLIPLDALAEHLGLSRRARLVSTVLEAVLVWPVVGIWGHPEDPLALAIALWGLLAAIRGRWRAAGWLFGVALVMQPLVILMVLVAAGLAPVREWPKLALRGVLPSAALLAIPLEQSWATTTTALFKQPNFPSIDHATPWVALAPVLSRADITTVRRFFLTTLPSGQPNFTAYSAHTMSGPIVAAGPGRMIAIALCAALGLYVYRRKPDAAQIVWLCCLALSLRCAFEAVMDPYYLWPPLALAVVLAARSPVRLAATAVMGTGITWWSYRFLGPWSWWAPIMVALVVVIVVAWPKRLEAPAPAFGRSEEVDAPVRGIEGGRPWRVDRRKVGLPA
jgi:hypothetical protein